MGRKLEANLGPDLGEIAFEVSMANCFSALAATKYPHSWPSKLRAGGHGMPREVYVRGVTPFPLRAWLRR